MANAGARFVPLRVPRHEYGQVPSSYPRPAKLQSQGRAGVARRWYSGFGLARKGRIRPSGWPQLLRTLSQQYGATKAARKYSIAPHGPSIHHVQRPDAWTRLVS